jgi:hypothetical protein
VIAGQAGPERGEEGLAEDGEQVVDVEVDGGRERVGAEGADDLGEPLLDGHPPSPARRAHELISGCRQTKRHAAPLAPPNPAAAPPAAAQSSAAPSS